MNKHSEMLLGYFAVVRYLLFKQSMFNLTRNISTLALFLTGVIFGE